MFRLLLVVLLIMLPFGCGDDTDTDASIVEASVEASVDAGADVEEVKEATVEDAEVVEDAPETLAD